MAALVYRDTHNGAALVYRDTKASASVNAAPLGVTATASAGTATAKGNATASPAGVTATASVGQVTATAGGSATAMPSGVGATASIGAAVARGAANVLANGLTAYAGVGTATASAGAGGTDPSLVSKTIVVTLKARNLSLQANASGINWTWSDGRGVVTSFGSGLVGSAAGVLSIPIKTRLLSDGVGMLTLDNYNGGNPLTYFGFVGPVRVP